VESPWGIITRPLFEALNSPLRAWAGQRVVDAFIGIKRTYVELEGGWCGVSLTPLWRKERPKYPLRLLEETPRSLVRRVEREENSYVASLAISAVNAATAAWLASTEAPQVRVLRRGQSILSVLGVKKGDYVVVLGYMRGIALDAKKLGARVLVSDFSRELLRRAELDGFPAIPGDSAKVLEEVEKASVVVFSGSSLLDAEHTVEEIRAARSARLRLLVGATSSFHPLIAERLGFNALAGVWFDPRVCLEVKSYIASGLGLHSVKRSKIVSWLWLTESK
jgi:hypothetical protein